MLQSHQSSSKGFTGVSLWGGRVWSSKFSFSDCIDIEPFGGPKGREDAIVQMITEVKGTLIESKSFSEVF